MDLVTQYAIISDQIQPVELRVILRELRATYTQAVPGDIVEFGCYEGTTSLFLQRVIGQYSDTPRTLHVYDSFAGLPEKTFVDESPSGVQFRAGELRASKANFIKHFRQAGLPLPVIHKGWFRECTPNDLPGQIAFAFLDGDFYDSIRDPLRLIWPRLSPGAIVVVDDYQSEALPGASRAVDEWLQTHQASLRTEASLAIIRPVQPVAVGDRAL